MKNKIWNKTCHISTPYLHNKMAKVYNVDIMSKQKVFLKILFLNILISQDDFLGDCVCFIFFKTVRDNWILNTTQLSKKSWNLKATTRFFFFYLGFLSRTFTIHGTAGEGGGYLFNSSLPLPPASQTLRH